MVASGPASSPTDVDRALGVDGVREAALVLLALGEVPERVEAPPLGHEARPLSAREGRFPLAEAAQRATSLAAPGWGRLVPGDLALPSFFWEPLERVLLRRRSVRSFAPEPVPRDDLAALLAWAAAPLPSDAPPVASLGLIVHAVDGLEPGLYRWEDGRLELLRPGEHRRLAGFLLLEQEHGARCAAVVFLLADLEAVLAVLGPRGYRWAQLEGGVRAGRLQVGAVALGWGATASTFYDDEVSRALATQASPLLAVALGPPRRR